MLTTPKNVINVTRKNAELGCIRKLTKFMKWHYQDDVQRMIECGVCEVESQKIPYIVLRRLDEKSCILNLTKYAIGHHPMCLIPSIQNKSFFKPQLKIMLHSHY